MNWMRLRYSAAVCVFLAWAGSPLGAQETLFSSLYAVENGDINGDGGRDVGDAIGLLEWLYLGGHSPVAMACQLEAPAVENGDVTGNGGIDLSDAVGLLGWLFFGGYEPIVSCPLDLAPSGGHGGGDRLRIIILTLRHFEGLSTQETARVLGIRRNTAAKRYVRAIHRVRALVKRASDN